MPSSTHYTDGSMVTDGNQLEASREAERRRVADWPLVHRLIPPSTTIQCSPAACVCVLGTIAGDRLGGGGEERVVVALSVFQAISAGGWSRSSREIKMRAGYLSSTSSLAQGYSLLSTSLQLSSELHLNS